jgi:hypothetical protein
VECENKSVGCNNRGEWNHFMRNMPRNHEIKELQKNSPIGHCTPNIESANVKVKVKVKQSHYRPCLALRVLGG